MVDGPTDEKEDRGSEQLGIRAVEIGLRVVRPLLDGSGPLPLKVISERSGFAPPKAHRYLVSLGKAGLVTQDKTGRYALGPMALEIGLAAIGLFDRDTLGRDALVELSAATETTTCLVVWANGGATVAAVEPAARTMFVGIRVGTILPLLRSASGRLFLSYQPRQIIERHLREELMTYPMDPALIEEMTSSVRRAGIARVIDTVTPGMSGIAAPVFDHNGRICYTLTALGPTNLFDASADGLLANSLVRKANELSAQLGYRQRSSA